MLRVALVPYLVDNIITESNVRSLLVHELRWARTFRTLPGWAQARSSFASLPPLAGRRCSQLPALSLPILVVFFRMRQLPLASTGCRPLLAVPEQLR